MTLVGTLKASKREVPKELLQKKNRSLYDSIMVFNQNDRTGILSYKAKKYKVVLLLSSLHNELKISDGEKKKPTVIEF